MFAAACGCSDRRPRSPVRHVDDRQKRTWSMALPSRWAFQLTLELITCARSPVWCAIAVPIPMLTTTVRSVRSIQPPSRRRRIRARIAWNAEQPAPIRDRHLVTKIRPIDERAGCH